MKSLLIIFLIFVAGCSSKQVLCEKCGVEFTPKPAPLQLPPEFHYGDQVVVGESERVGIVMDFQYYTPDGWKYTILTHSGTKLRYGESNLSLVKRFEWGSKASQAFEPKAEVENNSDFEMLEDGK